MLKQYSKIKIESQTTNNLALKMKLTILILILFVTGCTTIPKNPNFKVKPGESIGVLIDIPEKLTHTLIGTTIFNNSEKTYPYKWNLEAFAYNTITKSLRDKGYNVINLKETNTSYQALKEILIAKDNQWKINPKYTETYNTLQRLGIKSAIYFSSAKTVAFFQCGMSNCTDFYTESYGLFTRSFLGIKSNFAVAAFDNGIIITDPLAEVHYTVHKSFPLVNFKPIDFKNISESEWSVVKKQIIKYIEEFSNNLPDLMSNSDTET